MKFTFLFLASALSLGFLLAAPAAHAQAPTIITTAPYTITKPGKYQLGANLTVTNTSGNIITIDASNVSLDFNGHYISGPSGNASNPIVGVYAYNRGNLTVRNGTAAFCDYGILFDGNESGTSANINQRVENMLVSYCFTSAISFFNSRNSEVRNCRLSFIGGSNVDYTTGIDSVTATGTRLTNNVITNVVSAVGKFAVGSVGSPTTFAVGNTLTNCAVGIQDGKYMKNLTSGCATPFTGGINVGLNQ